MILVDPNETEGASSPSGGVSGWRRAPVKRRGSVARAGRGPSVGERRPPSMRRRRPAAGREPARGIPPWRWAPVRFGTIEYRYMNLKLKLKT